MNRISIRIEGKTPLLCNQFSDAAAMKATARTSGVMQGNDGSPQEMAARKVYIGHDGEPMIPQPNLYRSIIDAGGFHKLGKSKMTTQKTSLVPACIEIDAIEIPLQSKAGWTVDTRAVRIPSTGGRILCHRPCFHDWALEFDLLYDPDLIGPKLVRELLDTAGKRIGLGDFRPACKGPFGKFNVVLWREEEQEADRPA